MSQSGEPMTLADTIGKPRANLRAELLLNGPIVSTLFRLSWPNIIVMLAQSSTGLVETWWISHLGTDALAGMAVVFPVVMLMQMMSQGAMGGGISSAIARALGAGRRSEADAFVLHSIIINVVFGAFFSIAVLVFGPPPLSCSRRPRPLPRCGVEVLKRRVRGCSPAVDHEQLGERHSGHR
jgi:Na+-driven multidrug efflux pump